MNKNYLLLIILIFISNLNIINCTQELVDSPNLKLNKQNGHYYQRFTLAGNAVNAQKNCSYYTVNGTRGYLATFTSQDEWDWAWNLNLTLSGAWMGGNDLVSQTGVWWWDQESPEKYQLMYNLYFDKCYTFCLFGNLEPNLIAGEHSLHTSGSTTQPYINNNNGITASIGNFLCEWGGLTTPFIPTSPTTGSNITITNLGSYNIDQVTITFTSRTTLPTFKCLSKTKINSTSIICQIPSGQGKYIAVVSDGTKSSGNIYWNYELPYIGGVNAVFTKDALATITGANFGTVNSEVSVTIGDPAIPCSSVSITKAHEILTCKLSTSLPDDNKFLPISITVSGSKFVSYKAPVFYNNRYYSGFQTWATFEVSKSSYSNALRVDGQVGHLYSLVDSNLRLFLNKTLPKPFNNNRYYFWQNAKFVGNKKFVYIDGPNAGQNCPLLYSNDITLATNYTKWNESTRFIIYLDTLELQEATLPGSSGVITEYGGYDPTFPENITHSVNTNGGKVDIKIDNYGTVYSVIKVTFRSNNIEYVRDYINGELDVTIPPGFDGPYEIYVNVDNLRTPNKTQFIDYAAPNILSIPKIPTTGDKVTIIGESFSNTLLNTNLNFPGCTDLQILSNYFSYTCVLPAGSGSIPVSLRVSNKTSATFTFSYESPSITSTNSIAQIGGVLYINGENFSTKKEKIQIQIGSKSCTNVVIIENENKLSCDAPAQTAGTYDLTVTVDGLSSDPYQIKYFASDLSYHQIDADLYIIGTTLPTGATLILGSVDISSYCVGGGTQYNCTNLPLSVKSGDLSISKNSDIYPPLPIELYPWISSISNNLLDTVESTEITINGRYFENDDGSTYVLYDSNEKLNDSSSFTYINSEKVLVNISGGFGMNHKLKVVSKGFKSNSALFSFYAPEILKIYQNETMVTIIGLNFSSTDSIIQFGNYKPNVDYADSNKIQFTLDNLNSRNGYVTVDVLNQISNQVYLSIYPILNKVTPIPNLRGPTVITITGSFLNNKDYNEEIYNLNFYYQLKIGPDSEKIQQLNSCKEFETASSWTCEINDGFGYFDLYTISNDTLKSNIISSNYQAPQVLSVLTPVYYNEPKRIQIKVNYFTIDYTKVYIESIECTDVLKINETVLECYYDSSVSDEGKQALVVKVVSANIENSKAVLIYSTLFDCIDPKCSNHGTCNKYEGRCDCDIGYKGLSCQNIDNSNSTDSSDNESTVIIPPIVDENGQTEFITDKINFTVSITHLRELNIYYKTVKTLKLSNITWVSRNLTSKNVYYYKGVFDQDSAVFELTVKYFEKESQIEFAGEPLYMPENSIKYEVTISNWNFSSSLNILQTIYNSKTDKESTFKCDKVVSTSTFGTNQFQINTAKGSFAAKFSSRIIIDDRIIKSNVKALDNNDELYNSIKLNNTNQYNLLTAIETPLFNDKIILDPLFSSLINDKNDDNNDQCKNRWKIPVIVVLSTVGGLSIITAGAIFYRRKIKFSKYLKKVNSVELSNK